MDIHKLIIPVSIFLGSIIIGWILEKLIIPLLARIASKTSFKFDDIIIGAFRKIIVLLISVLGLRIALRYIVFYAQHEHITNKFILAMAQHENIINKIVLGAIILLITIVVMRICVGFVDIYMKSIIPASSLFQTLTKLIILIIGLLIILQSVGVSITPILTTLGIGGLAVALALQDTLSNIFSGLHILGIRQIKIGDYIKLDEGYEGHVVDIGWRNTTIKLLSNNMVIIPNSKLVSTIVTNYYMPDREFSIPVKVGVSYDSNLEKVEKVTIEEAQKVMKEIKGGVPEFIPSIRYNSFSESSIDFNVILRGKEYGDQYLIIHEFIKRLNKRYIQEGIVIPFPIRTVYMQK